MLVHQRVSYFCWQGIPPISNGKPWLSLSSPDVFSGAGPLRSASCASHPPWWSLVGLWWAHKRPHEKLGHVYSIKSPWNLMKIPDSPCFFTIKSPFSQHYTGWWCNNHLEKYEFVNGKDDIPYIMENINCIYMIYLVRGWPTSEKYESQLGWLFPHIMENKKCSKPPSRYDII